MAGTDINSKDRLVLESLSDSLILVLGWECALSWGLELAPALIGQIEWAKTTTTIGEVGI